MSTLYPSNPLIDDSYPIANEAIDILNRFKLKKTFNKPINERFQAMISLIKELSEFYLIPTPHIFYRDIDGSFSGNSYYSPHSNTICLSGHLSIITLLHEFGHARGFSEYGAVRFSVNLFKRVYPNQFNKLRSQKHCLMKLNQSK